ncbi:hypothetical protein ACLESD_12755 [Pyxidicoccus sp. 3LFB2]
MVQSRFVSMRGAFVLLGMLFTAACGGPVEAEDPAVTPEPAESQEVSALAYTCGDTAGTCAPGYKCCYPCGVDGCQWQCQQVTRCPFIP